jgi:two-component system, LytTR family, sensor kinase
MKIPHPPRYQVVGFWLSMPFITLALTYIMYHDRLLHDWKIWAIAYPVIYAVGYLSWRTHYIYDHAIHVRYPSLKDTRKRVWLIAPVNLLVMTPSVLLIFFVFHWFEILGYQIQEIRVPYRPWRKHHF